MGEERGLEARASARESTEEGAMMSCGKRMGEEGRTSDWTQTQTRCQGKPESKSRVLEAARWIVSHLRGVDAR
eukprot:2871427-Rhodomonas_salina.1